MRAETPNHSPEHLPHQGRALVHHARHGRARPEEPGAAAEQVRHAGRSAAAAARRRSARRAQVPGIAGRRRDARAHARRRAALRPRLDLRGHAVARGAGCRPAVGAAAQAARERAGRALADAQDLCRRRASRASAAASAIRPASGSATRRAGRSAGARRCSARTPRRCWARRRAARACRHEPRGVANPRLSALHDKPFPLQGIKILDFAWFLASAGGTRFLAAMGAESFKVEWKDNPDTRLAAMAPVGGRAARDAATGPLPGVKDPDMGGQFNNKNAGKRGISLNIRHPKGLQIAKDLVRDLRRRGRGVLARRAAAARARLRRAEERSGRTSSTSSNPAWARTAPTAGCAPSVRSPRRSAGRREMSGLPEPAMPVGWGYSYLDWMGAYGYALALLGALYHRERTGEGQWIDASQCEVGHFPDRRDDPRLVGERARSGAATATARPTSRRRRTAPIAAPARTAGSRSPASPMRSGARWRRWPGRAAWLDDRRFDTLEHRLLHQDALDAAVEAWTAHAGPLRLHDDAAARRRAGRRVPERRGPLRHTIRSCGTSNG